MKSFEEVKEFVKGSLEAFIVRLKNNLNVIKDKNNRTGIKMTIEDYLLKLEHLDEETIVEIGYRTNQLIFWMQTHYKEHTDEYNNDFDKFLNDYILGGSECMILGCGADELSCFKGKNPNDKETCDKFIELINLHFGTTIPLTGEIDLLLEEDEKDRANYDWKTWDSDKSDRNYIRYKEAQRDSGELKALHLKGLYADKTYLAAKKRVEGRTL